jgi:hypothetical protein
MTQRIRASFILIIIVFIIFLSINYLFIMTRLLSILSFDQTILNFYFELNLYFDQTDVLLFVLRLTRFFCVGNLKEEYWNGN